MSKTGTGSRGVACVLLALVGGCATSGPQATPGRTSSPSTGSAVATDRVAAPFDWRHEEVPGFQVSLAPRAGLTWGPVGSRDDVTVRIERVVAPAR